MALLLPDAFKSRLCSDERFLSDGGMATSLQVRGIMPEDVLRANQGLADEVCSIHGGYLEAGANVLLANTFGVREGNDWQRNISAGLKIAWNVVRRWERPISLWATFPSFVILREAHALEFLATRDPHWPGALLIETGTSLLQMREAVLIAKSFHPHILAASCHFDKTGRMPDGTSPALAAEALEGAGADIIGANCGEIPETFVDIAVKMREATPLPLWFQPSAGMPMFDGNWHTPPAYSLSDRDFANLARRLWETGVSIVGGCCGTTPAHIHAARAYLTRRNDLS